MAQEAVRQNNLMLVVGIATTGRRAILSALIDLMAQQTRLPDRLIICPMDKADVDLAVLERFPAKTQVVFGPKGACAQRNAIVAAAGDADAMVFFDDDYLPHPTFLARTEKIFNEMPDVVVASGKVLIDGANGPGLSSEEGLRILKAASSTADHGAPYDIHHGYGCNLAFRLDVARSQGVAFDTTLPLYAWCEDLDFCRQLARFGRIVRSDDLLGVHLGTKTGRISGTRLGYSQIANPVYLATKGTLEWWRAITLMGRIVAANLLRSEKCWIDRRGRRAGNLLAFRDLLRRRLAPQRILDIN
jgi:GT2 family glycosyltransferase